jgi:hypothetical protein
LHGEPSIALSRYPTRDRSHAPAKRTIRRYGRAAIVGIDSPRQFDSGAVHLPRVFAESGDFFAGERRMNLGGLYADSYADSEVEFDPNDHLLFSWVDLRSATPDGLESSERPIL